MARWDRVSKKDLGHKANCMSIRIVSMQKQTNVDIENIGSGGQRLPSI
jgi:hypothetical protein